MRVSLNNKRLEKDCVGELQIDRDSLKGIHTHRGEQNSPLLTALPYPTLIKSLFFVKQACLNTNTHLGYIPEDLAIQLSKAIDDGIEGKLNQLFKITMFQGGAGGSCYGYPGWPFPRKLQVQFRGSHAPDFTHQGLDVMVGDLGHAVSVEEGVFPQYGKRRTKRHGELGIDN